MAAAQDSDMRSGLITSILCFMNGELKKDDVTPDKAESLEVAIQCLKLAYNIPDLDDLEEPNLLELYSKAVAQLPPPPTISEEDIKRAEEVKKEGNEFMKVEKYDEAIEKYTDAIKVDPKSAVYYCNRAAAHTGRGDYQAALADCKKAVYIDKSYSKAYSRMGLTYSKMEKYELAVECYENALKLDPNNAGYQSNMKIAKDKIQESQPNTSPFPGFGGAGGFSDMLRDPMMMNMAQQVMKDPAMQQMAMNMMSSFMGAGNPSENGGSQQGSGMPEMSQMSEMLRMGQQFAAHVSQDNPELVESLRQELGKSDDKPKVEPEVENEQ